ncbi:hypothetical protein GYMLUDRAFT_51162 [Collybiopsis luxurians FD-317 M1]|uniref:Unplaced genomic scaffold GYMLUscaffold_153, whole genome shotgun sequence n=1 Tax=Collybiopsis luxurians FD-317 M1 TaxID=944289 RepID=A0A0D0AJU6_9AGAR|nr:hypothetical protein GYMLUDRAFT_51162 [Collybiopsis luxurians FD-317 M1]
MRVSVPHIPQSVLALNSPVNRVSTAEAIDRVSSFLAPGNVTLITGAGVSVDSGIRSYRGADGRYINPNYKPIFYHELTSEDEQGQAFRRRYWLRSYLGYPSVRDSLPNTTHFALAALQYSGVIPRIITQNVDGLHHKALAVTDPSPTFVQDSILELHGTLHRVRCKHGHITDRSVFQDWLASANPKWKQFADAAEQELRTNPDGDVAIEHLGVSYNEFVIPECPICLQENRHINMHKPDLVFFGESIHQSVKNRSYLDVERSDRLLLIGTTLSTFSAFRLLKHALQLQKPTLLINVGPSRADGIPGVEKLDVPSGDIMRQVARNVIGNRSIMDDLIEEMLSSGIRKPPVPDA